MVANWGYSVVAVHGLLTVVASLIVDHGLQGAWEFSSCDPPPPALECAGSIAMAHRLACTREL